MCPLPVRAQNPSVCAVRMRLCRGGSPNPYSYVFGQAENGSLGGTLAHARFLDDLTPGPTLFAKRGDHAIGAYTRSDIFGFCRAPCRMWSTSALSCFSRTRYITR